MDKLQIWENLYYLEDLNKIPFAFQNNYFEDYKCLFKAKKSLFLKLRIKIYL